VRCVRCAGVGVRRGAGAEKGAISVVAVDLGTGESQTALVPSRGRCTAPSRPVTTAPHYQIIARPAPLLGPIRSTRSPDAPSPLSAYACRC
jgi:hypothetical protein